MGKVVSGILSEEVALDLISEDRKHKVRLGSGKEVQAWRTTCLKALSRLRRRG